MQIKFITGGAGTGKSHLLRELLQKENRKFIVCAPTGIAAQNINGATIHSAFNINPESLFVPSSIARGPLAGLEVIYIDEVSMMGAHLFKAVMYAANHLGVKEIILFGDLAQLPPVKDKPFHKHALPTAIEELTTIHRQATDLKFAEVLNAIRSGDQTYNQIQWLNKNANFGSDHAGVTLAFSNAVVDSINTKSLHQLDGDLNLYEAKVGGGMSERDVLAAKDLYLKDGCKVIMLNNDPSGNWKNGTPAIVTKCYEEDAIQVKIKDEIYDVEPFTWFKKAPKEIRGERMDQLQQDVSNEDEDKAEYAQHCLDNGYELTPVGSFEQLPVKLAYAMTVHKSQGLTLENVHIIPDGFYKMHGIGYVALSRLTTLGGLSLSRPFKINDFRIDQSILL